MPAFAIFSQPLGSGQFSRRTPFLLILCLLLVGVASPSSAYSEGRELERIYEGWRKATVANNIDGWLANTASHRAALTRNQIISQKLHWPQALFEVPAIPPQVSQLKLLKFRQNQAAAQLVYFGPVDFGVITGDLPENVLILNFSPKSGSWGFDRFQFVNLQANPEVAKQVAAGQLDFLNSGIYALPSSPPPTPAIVKEPDYIGHLKIESPGYQTIAVINGKSHRSEAANAATTDVIIGGLKRGENSLSLTFARLPDTDAPGSGELPPVSISVFASNNLQTRAPARVFHYVPEEIPPSVRTSVWVTPNTLAK